MFTPDVLSRPLTPVTEEGMACGGTECCQAEAPPPHGPSPWHHNSVFYWRFCSFFFLNFIIFSSIIFFKLGERKLESVASPAPPSGRVGKSRWVPGCLGHLEVSQHMICTHDVCIYKYICVFICDLLSWTAPLRDTAPPGGNTLLSAVVLLYTGENKQEMCSSFSLQWNLISNKHFKKKKK